MQNRPVIAAILAAMSPFAWANQTPNLQQAINQVTNQVTNQAKSHLAASLDEFNITDQDLAESELLSQYQTDHNGVSHLVFRQHVNGIEVFGGDIQFWNEF